MSCNKVQILHFIICVKREAKKRGPGQPLKFHVDHPDPILRRLEEERCKLAKTQNDFALENVGMSPRMYKYLLLKAYPLPRYVKKLREYIAREVKAK